MPPVVTGAVVAVIGLNLAGIPIKNMAPTPFDAWMQGVTFLCVAGVAVFTRGMTQRLLILVGLIVASVRLRAADQRPGPGQADRPVGHRQRGLVRRCRSLRSAGVRRATRCC
jgi:putative pyrimidine permease RutG